ncbi:MAG: PhoH family protein [Candidatus Competibacterales bacterium]
MPPDEAAPEVVQLDLEPADNARLFALCGPQNHHLDIIEKHLKVEINNRSHHFTFIGDPLVAAKAKAVVEALYDRTAAETLEAQDVQTFLQDANLEILDGDAPSFEEVVIRFRKGGSIQGRGINQKRYLYNMVRCDINFGVGPAGTGKTYLAVARAVEALERSEVKRLILVRPAVEAGERLGFLPGDLVQKVDPYLRPLYDALYELMGPDQVVKSLERGIIEIAPLAFMRGRTLNEAFIILDEAQNTTVEQMKMFLTRLGFGSTAVITGDVTQVDLPRNVASGLRHALQVLEGVEGISMTHFGARDVVRHPLVQRIVNAYARFEARGDGIGGDPPGDSP